MPEDRMFCHLCGEEHSWYKPCSSKIREYSDYTCRNCSKLNRGSAPYCVKCGFVRRVMDK